VEIKIITVIIVIASEGEVK